jgi:hypothetical protein
MHGGNRPEIGMGLKEREPVQVRARGFNLMLLRAKNPAEAGLEGAYCSE